MRTSEGALAGIKNRFPDNDRRARSDAVDECRYCTFGIEGDPHAQNTMGGVSFSLQFSPMFQYWASPCAMRNMKIRSFG